MFSLNFSTMSRGHSPTQPLTLPHLGTHIIIFDLRLELPPRANMLLIIHKSDRTWSRRHSGAIESPYWWFQMGDLPNTRPMDRPRIWHVFPVCETDRFHHRRQTGTLPRSVLDPFVPKLGTAPAPPIEGNQCPEGGDTPITGMAQSPPASGLTVRPK